MDGDRDSDWVHDVHRVWVMHLVQRGGNSASTTKAMEHRCEPGLPAHHLCQSRFHARHSHLPGAPALRPVPPNTINGGRIGSRRCIQSGPGDSRLLLRNRGGCPGLDRDVDVPSVPASLQSRFNLVRGAARARAWIRHRWCGLGLERSPPPSRGVSCRVGGSCRCLLCTELGQQRYRLNYAP